MLYAGLLAQASRREAKSGEGESRTPPPDAQKVLGHVRGLFPEGRDYLQIGGNETVGMGWCRVAFQVPAPTEKER